MRKPREKEEVRKAGESNDIVAQEEDEIVRGFLGYYKYMVFFSDPSHIANLGLLNFRIVLLFLLSICILGSQAKAVFKDPVGDAINSNVVNYGSHQIDGSSVGKSWVRLLMGARWALHHCSLPYWGIQGDLNSFLLHRFLEVLACLMGYTEKDLDGFFSLPISPKGQLHV
ncbi:hypothetical protein HPP92_020985 [Vanilla planifolia]|uniref:Uncharacterized protein n=1 Tax=Vanilla planifolia TaxID=51239 RepID=A0A835UGP3_VANPL|nr:hypothetical protein HPP92_020985 [Vanilla planifolia]